VDGNVNMDDEGSRGLRGPSLRVGVFVRWVLELLAEGCLVIGCLVVCYSTR
jgi:hypothetical protein